MPLQYSFLFSRTADFTDKTKRNLKELFETLKPCFPELASSALELNIAIMAHNELSSGYLLVGSKGRCYNRDIPWHNQKLIHTLCTFGPYDDIAIYDYVIVLSYDSVASDSPIERIFTVAHEMQHIYQNIFLRDTFLKCIILYKYFVLIEKPEIYHYSLPHDKDAQQKAKQFNYRHNTQEAVDLFITQKIESIKDDVSERAYWDQIKEINEYDFRTETEKLWTNNIGKIEEMRPNNKCLNEAFLLRQI